MLSRRLFTLSLAAAASVPLGAQASPACPLPPEDSALRRALDAIVRRLRLTRPVAERRLAISLLELDGAPRYAGVNDSEMLYAASLPKIAILAGGFDLIERGELRYTPAVRNMFTRLIRFSSNEDASRAIQTIGFENIARTLRSPQYRLYDPDQNGGLWLGKAYGGPNDRWKRDPLHQLSHGATSAQVARFFWMVDSGRLVSPEASAEMKRLLSKPGIAHKFVKGLAGLPHHEIYRKSGTWRNFHADGALIEAGDHKYVAVALMEDARGGEVLPQLIREMDRLVCGPGNELATGPGGRVSSSD